MAEKIVNFFIRNDLIDHDLSHFFAVNFTSSIVEHALVCVIILCNYLVPSRVACMYCENYLESAKY